VKKPIELRWPLGGISEDQAHGKQLPNTTPHAKNVRTLDPKSGRSQGAQRPGYANFTSQALYPGKAVDALASVSVDLPKVEYRGPDESEILRVWGHTVPGLRAARALAVDVEGNLYVLDGAGGFQKIGPDGKVESTYSFHVPNGEGVVDRIQVDFSGNVYVGTTHGDGYSSRLIRLDRVDADDADGVDYIERWSHYGLWGLRDFRVAGGVAVLCRFFSAQSEGSAEADILTLGLLHSAEPLVLWTSPSPWPVSNIDLNDQGEVLVSAPATDKRGKVIGEEEWSLPVESWSPHELEDVTGFGASRRLHSWSDVQTIQNDYLNGAIASICQDRRWLHSSLDFETTTVIEEDDGAFSGGGGVTYVPPTDLKARPLIVHIEFAILQASIASGLGVVHGMPLFIANGAGTVPVIRFNDEHNEALDNLESDHAGMSWDKGNWNSKGQKTDTDSPYDGFPNDDGIMADQMGCFPAHKRAVFSTFLMVRYNVSPNRPSVLFQQTAKSGGTQITLVMNVDSADVYGSDGAKGSLAGTTAGRLTLYVGNDTGVSKAGNFTGTTGYAIASCDLTHADFASPQNVALICIHVSGANVTDGPDAGVNGRCQFRVNGRVIDRWTLLDDNLDGARSTIAGTGMKPFFPNWQGFGPGDYESFHGDLMECITVLGDTTDEDFPNEVPVTGPVDGSGAPPAPGAAEQWTDMSGSAETYADDPVIYTNHATEIERIEGWLAYRWGCPNILKGGGAAASTTDFQDMHPFGLGVNGGAVTAPNFPVGSPAAGGSVITDDGAALVSPDELLLKIGVSGQVRWAISGGGHGLGVTVGPDGSVLTVGRHDETAGETVIAKRLRDAGGEVYSTGNNTWELEDDDNIASIGVPGMATDAAGNLYWPRKDEAYSALIDFVAVPLNGETLTLTSAPTIPAGNITYLFQDTLVAVTGVLIGADKFEAAMNFAAAVNDSSPGGDIAPYGSAIAKHLAWSASVETNGTDVSVRVTRIGADGLARITVPVAYVRLQLSDLPTSATQLAANRVTFGTGINNRVEARAAEDGKLLWSKPYTAAAEYVDPHAVALDPDIPLYPNDDPLEGVPEHIYVAQTNNVESATGAVTSAPTGDNVQKLRQVDGVQVIGADKSPRRTVHAATCNGNFFVLTKGQSPRLVNNGHGVFNPASPFAKLWTYRQKVYGLDGQSYVRFDPKKLLMEEWVAEGAGKIPYGAKLACVFSECIVLGRTANDPHNFHLSERGNPDGWDTDPTVLTPLSAFSGASTGNLNFRKHDLVNCLIPARDDLLIIGGDQSISRLSGHPGSGGQLDNISTSEGLAFGDSYCVGPVGTVFAKTTNAGVLRIAPNGVMDRITLRSIERRLQDVDLSEFDIRMAWNFRHEGLHVFQVPKGAGERIVEHWYWDAKENGWWADEFSTVGVQPTSVAVFDGDEPGDRVVAIGCEDGFVRYETENAKDDGGYRIASEVVLGPLVPDGAARARFSHLEATLSSSSSPATVGVFTDDVSDIVAGRDPFYQGSAGPGYQGYNMFQASGNQAWVKLGNSALSESFSLESLFIRATVVGKRRRF
jgi:hypothetical protein